MNLSALYLLLYIPATLLLVWGGVHVVLFFSSRLLLYQWWRAPKYWAPPKQAEIISFKKNTREFYGWFFTPPKPQSRKWVVFFHGNYTTIDQQMDAVEGYLKLGYQVLLPEYHGFRQLKGWPTRKKIREDLLTLISEVSSQKTLAISDCVFHCFSLGGIIGPDLLSNLNPAAVIVEASVPSPKEFMRAFGIHHRILLDQYDNLPLLQKFQGDILVLSYLYDKVIPPKFMQAFKEHLPNGKFFEWQQEHNSIRRSSEAPQFWSAIKKFLDQNSDESRA